MISLKLWVVFFCFSITSAAQCSKKPIIFNFGDSNSDTGGGSVLKGFLLNTAGRVFFHHPTGRVCDGRLVIDFLCESLATKYLTPYFQLFAQDFSNGVNFALAGSNTLQSESPTTLTCQIKRFNFFHNISIQHSYFSEDEFKSAIFMLDIGQNDIVGTFDGNKTLDRVLTLIPDVINKIGEAIQDIYQFGGKNIWVHNTGPLGCLPRKIRGRNASQVLDEYGCVAEINAAADEFNTQLDRLCQELRSKLVGSTFVCVDVHSIKLDIIANYSSYGFQENPSVSCLGQAREEVCPQGSRRVFWDGDHYTEAANAIIASKIVSTAYSTPSLEINFFCN